MSTRQGPPKPPPPPNVVRWEIQTANGKISGPFTTTDVLKQISEGQLKGGEKIKRYPDGTWVLISKQPQFYDHLLNALNDVATTSKPETRGKATKIIVSKVSEDSEVAKSTTVSPLAQTPTPMQKQTIDLYEFSN